MENEWGDPSVRLFLSDDVQDKMARQGVEENDVRQVISFAESTTNKLMNVKTGRFIAHLKTGSITCWAEYAPQEGGYRVFSVYTHRMEIEEES